MKVKAILALFRPDLPLLRPGQIAFRYTETETGKTIAGLTDTENAVHDMLKDLNGGTWLDIGRHTYYIDQAMPQREFERWTQPFPYAGATAEDLARYVRTALDDPETKTLGED